MKKQGSYTYLALGDSYTIGEKLDPRENFPNQVVQILREKGLNFYAPSIVAQTGWTTDELKTGIENVKLKGHYDFVTLLIGVNDQYRGRTVDEYIPVFEALLDQAIRFTGDKPSHVVVLSIPDWGVTPFAAGSNRDLIASAIDTFNDANRKITLQKNVHYLDITPGTRASGNDPVMLAEDGLHPSAKEYRKWAVAVASVFHSSK